MFRPKGRTRVRARLTAGSRRRALRASIGGTRIDLLGGSGPQVAGVFRRGLGAVLIAAWLSLGAQVHLLVGSRGLLPLEPLARSLAADPDAGFARFPSLLRYWPSDAALCSGIALGVALAALVLAGVGARVALALSAALYLSFAIACREFLSFQWDNLLVECCVLAALVPADRRARWAHALLLLLGFKLYFESGLAKWQSHLHDWHDGSAMSFYYETAPIPSPLAWWAHALPGAWHRFESRAALALELVVPFAMLGPRRARLLALLALTGFQLVNLATSNYGFFVYLALCLHLFLLDDRDIERARAWLGRRLRALRRRLARGQFRPRRAQARFRLLARTLRRLDARLRWPARIALPARAARGLAAGLAAAAVVAWTGISLADGVARFARGAGRGTLEAMRQKWQPYRIVNVYHLFGHITRDRIEPEFQSFDGERWAAHDLHHKPGDPRRAPPFVAPHQPRVDFRLWFYGLQVWDERSRSVRPRVPPWVGAILQKMCADPDAVQPLFAAPLPRAPRQVRVAFWRYRFTTAAERSASGAWWKREELGATRPFGCR